MKTRLFRETRLTDLIRIRPLRGGAAVVEMAPVFTDDERELIQSLVRLGQTIPKEPAAFLEVPGWLR